MPDNLIKAIQPEYEDFLRDESRSTGYAESISFPKSEGEIIKILSELAKSREPVTMQGARTGITAGAVPFGGHVLNLGGMNKITGLSYDERQKCFLLRVQPGVLLTDIKKALEIKEFDTGSWPPESIAALDMLRNSGNWFFSPDPTETSASIGGMAGCNASGARSFKFGPTRRYIEAMRIILADGSAVTLKRGLQKAQGRSFELELDNGEILTGDIPKYRMPDVKNASGYFAADNMDLIDMFIGSEGTLGIITEMEIRLLQAPKSIWGVTAFFPRDEEAVRFVRGIRGERVEFLEAPLNYKPAAIEFFNNDALELLKTQKRVNPAFAEIPELPAGYHTSVYIEYHGGNEDVVSDMVFGAVEVLTACGGSEDTTWIATNPKEMEKLHFFRHAVPEAVNLLIGERRKKNSSITKLGTDMAVPDDRLSEVMELYKSGLEQSGLQSVMFGHIGNNHIHVNILPNNMEEYNKGKELYLTWAEKVIEMGGTVSAEHGIGKLKIDMLRKMYGEDGVRQMLELKKLFDPEYRLNRGNLFRQKSDS